MERTGGFAPDPNQPDFVRYIAVVAPASPRIRARDTQPDHGRASGQNAIPRAAPGRGHILARSSQTDNGVNLTMPRLQSDIATELRPDGGSNRPHG